MIQEFFDSIEDPKRPLLGPNYWLIEKVGLILPKNLISKILYLMCHEFVSAFVLTQYIEVYMVRSDLDLILTNLTVSVNSFICVVKANAFIYWQNDWKEVLKYITEIDKSERGTSDTTMKQIINSYTKYCRLLIKFYWVLLLTTCICVSGTPLIRYLSSSNYREAISNGTEPFPHIFSSWVPFDKFSSPGCWITVCIHIFCCAYGATMTAAYDSMILVIMIFFEGSLKLLRHKCKKMFGSNGLGVTDEQAKITLRELYTTHTLMLK
ncbi:unnamed protein product [Euphydryas editha]|uniref:Uncharacterized protein n=1 Tax=Euphydryas editha TaxID=104508 RepID=A0AAU9V7U7_EUPED|nr:unnamed protein product [Euphydryas editha]